MSRHNLSGIYPVFRHTRKLLKLFRHYFWSHSRPQNDTGSRAFTVRVEECVNRVNQSFSLDSGNPLVTMASLLNQGCPDSDVEETIYDFYNRHSIVCWGELLGLRLNAVEETPDMAIYPFEAFRLPWEQLAHISHKTLLYGPCPHDYCAKEVKRTGRLLHSIKQHGYSTAIQRDAIRGYILQAEGGRSRFVVKGGQHRVAVLAVLGIEEVMVEWQPGWNQVIRETDVDIWPHVAAGHISSRVALQVFRSFV